MPDGEKQAYWDKLTSIRNHISFLVRFFGWTVEIQEKRYKLKH